MRRAGFLTVPYPARPDGGETAGTILSTGATVSDTALERPDWACLPISIARRERPQSTCFPITIGTMSEIVPTDADIARFRAKVRVCEESGCHIWTASLSKGYGRFSARKKFIYAHRFAWLVEHGSLPPRPLHLDHLCRRPACVNPAHLEPVTCRENQMRSPISISAAHARQTHCVNGHPFDSTNTYFRSDGRGRICKTCGYDRKRTKRERNKRLPATHCNEGHEFSAGNTHIRPGGKRLCKTCRADGQRRRRAERVA